MNGSKKCIGLKTMAKDPAVLFYTSDFLSGVSFFTHEQTGQYIILLCQQHQKGSIPFNHMISICGSNDSPVFKKFVQDEHGNYYNERMRHESERRKQYCESRRNSKSGRKSIKIIRKSYDNHTLPRMENENENENINVIVNGNKAFEEVWLEYPNKDGKKEAQKHFLASVKTEKDLAEIRESLEKYKKHLELNSWKRPKNGSTWFNNWRDWLNWTEPQNNLGGIQNARTTTVGGVAAPAGKYAGIGK